MKNGKQGYNDFDRDKFLDLLIKKATQDTSVSLKLPDTRTILAYIDGVATDEQVSQVQSALSDYPEFRSMIVELKNQSEVLGDPAAAGRFDSVEVPSLEKVNKHISSGLLDGFFRWIKSFGERVDQFISARVLVPATAAATIAVMALILLPSGPALIKMKRAQDIESYHFAMGSVKGTDAELPTTSIPSASEAAVAEFKNIISYDIDSKMFLFSEDYGMIDSSISNSIIIRLVDDNEKPIDSLQLRISDQELKNMDETTELWLLIIDSSDSFTLWHERIGLKSTDVLNIEWKIEWGKGAFAVTYQQGDTYRSVRGVPFQIEN